jgi:predicted DNA-binding transcriptional regulator AlpA
MDPDTIDTSEYLTDSGLAVEYGVSTRTIQRVAQEPGFPAPVRIGRLRRWNKSEVEAYFRGRASAANETEATD